MSAKYTCDLCNKKMFKHVNSYSQSTWISRKFYKSKHSWEASVVMKIKFHNEGTDMCSECVDDIKQEAIKELKKIKII